jgi:hypothetical protein
MALQFLKYMGEHHDKADQMCNTILNTNLDGVYFKGVKHNEQTVWPKGFQLPS